MESFTVHMPCLLQLLSFTGKTTDREKNKIAELVFTCLCSSYYLPIWFIPNTSMQYFHIFIIIKNINTIINFSYNDSQHCSLFFLMSQRQMLNVEILIICSHVKSVPLSICDLASRAASVKSQHESQLGIGHMLPSFGPCNIAQVGALSLTLSQR